MAPEYRVRDYSGMKKRRGWRVKYYHTVKVTNITPDGFWLHNMGKSYYIKRINFPWTLDATDEELRDVVRCKRQSMQEYTAQKEHIRSPHSPNENDSFMWGLLDFEVLVRWVENPKTLEAHKSYTTYVRSVHRYDLFKHWENGIKIQDNTPPAK